MHDSRFPECNQCSTEENFVAAHVKDSGLLLCLPCSMKDAKRSAKLKQGKAKAMENRMTEWHSHCERMVFSSTPELVWEEFKEIFSQALNKHPETGFIAATIARNRMVDDHANKLHKG